MDCELPNDDSRAEGASWVHGAAGEVDLLRKCGAKNEGSEAARRGALAIVLAQTPTPHNTSPVLECIPSATRHEGLRENISWPFRALGFSREGSGMCTCTVSPPCPLPQ